MLRSREAADVNAEVREALDRDGHSLFRIGLSLFEIPRPKRARHTQVSAFRAGTHASPTRFPFIDVLEETRMGRGILLWLLGVPIPVIILLWLFFGH